ncbi:MAG: DUF4249 domain-containing protein [Cyclobacteriaceae bacterium]
MKKQLIFFFTFVLLDSCIDEFTIAAPDALSQLVVDGRITDAPGPYTVNLSRTKKLDDFISPRFTVSAKSVAIFDKNGNSEVLSETSSGTYQTSPTGIRGIVGREYFLRIETRDGKIYESIPEKINPSGTIDSVYYEFKKDVQLSGIAKYYFRIFIDSKVEPDGENYFLWKLTGTYRVTTSPELHILLQPELLEPPPPPKKTPRPCSGFIIDKRTGDLLKVGPCECCQCWANLVDPNPNVSDNQIVANGQFKKIEVGVIPVEFWPFWDKTMVTVEQMSLSKSTYSYWKTIRNQKVGATSLFQPAIGKATSNIFLKNGSEEVQGLFQASSISKKIIFLTSRDIPLGAGVIPPPPVIPPRYVPTGAPPIYEEFLSEPFVIRESCLNAFKHSTTQQPPDWK